MSTEIERQIQHLDEKAAEWYLVYRMNRYKSDLASRRVALIARANWQKAENDLDDLRAKRVEV